MSIQHANICIYVYALDDRQCNEKSLFHLNQCSDYKRLIQSYNKQPNSVLDPDGKLRTVKYTADKENGFQASVITDGMVVSHPPTAVHPAGGGDDSNSHDAPAPPHAPPKPQPKQPVDDESEDSGDEEYSDE